MHLNARQRYFDKIRTLEEKIGVEAASAVEKIIDDMIEEHELLVRIHYSSARTLKWWIIIQAFVFFIIAYAFSRYHQLERLFGDFAMMVATGLALIGIVWIILKVQAWRTRRHQTKMRNSMPAEDVSVCVRIIGDKKPS